MKGHPLHKPGQYGFMKKPIVIAAAIFGLFLLLVLIFGLIFNGSAGAAKAPAQADGQTVANFGELKSMSEKSKGVDYMAKYAITPDPSVGEGTAYHTYYSKAGNFRIDMNSINGSIQALQMYKIGENAYACLVDPGNTTCLFVGTEEELGGDSALDEIRDNLAAYEISVLRGREILGIEAVCFSIRPRELASSEQGYLSEALKTMAIENCFSEEGIPLEASSPFSTMTIVSLSRDVPEDAFNLPSEPVYMDGTQ